MTKHDQPEAAPAIVARAQFDAALAEQVAAEKEVTRLDDRVSARRRPCPWSRWRTTPSPVPTDPYG
jgi:predicted dithiol-disulfide oxidoreductase (DUF899 family)